MFNRVRSMVGLVMQAAGNLVEVDVLELSRLRCRGGSAVQISVRPVVTRPGTRLTGTPLQVSLECPGNYSLMYNFHCLTSD